MKRNKIINSLPLKVDNLSIVFNHKKQDEYWLLKNICYDFEPGKIYFIIGNSGVGKTTLVTHFNGLLKSKFGNIYVKNFSILGKDKKVKKYKKIRKIISLVLQFPEYQLFKDTVENDIIYGPVNFGIDKTTAKNRARYYINKLQLPEKYLNESPFSLSGGQKRKVALAGVLSIESDIIIFDEPTAGLDPLSEKQIYKIILDLKKQEKTVIVITHMVDHILEYGDHVIVLHDNKIFAIGSPYDIFLNDNIINNLNFESPKIIQFINKIRKFDHKYNKLLDLKPRNINDLAKYINQIK